MKRSKRTYALVAGVSLVIMALAAGFSFGYVYNGSVVEGDPTGTFRNLLSARSLFIGGIAGWIVIFLTDILVAWALYHFLAEVDRRLSAVTAWIRVIYAAILGVAIYNLIAVIPLVVSGDKTSITNATMVSDYLAAFESAWSAGLIIFGIHLLGLGYLSVRSAYVPRIFGWLLLFAGAGYFFLHSGKTFLDGYDDLLKRAEMILSVPMTIAEIGFAIWLIIAGGKAKSITHKEIKADALTIGKTR